MARPETNTCPTPAAAAESVSFLVFPELSLSSYEPELLCKCIVSPDAKLLHPLRQIASNESGQWLGVCNAINA
jgi:predicted amidohydrolase